MEDIMSAVEETEASTPTRGATSEQEASDPTAFDLAAFVRGVRPIERGVTLYGRGDLLADRDFAMTQMDDAKARGDMAEYTRLQALARELTDTMAETALDVRVQGWSSSKVDRFLKSLKEQGVTDDEERSMHLVAAQIVEPEGMTVEVLRDLRETIEPQIVRLIQTVTAVDTTVPKVSIPF